MGIHQDFGMGTAEYGNMMYAYSGSKCDVNEWMKGFNEPDVKGYRKVCFWRPIHMKGPVKGNPLALCDPQSTRLNDVVPSELHGFTSLLIPTSQAVLKYHPGHKWHYYPDMTNDEVIVFKQFECFKGIDD